MQRHPGHLAALAVAAIMAAGCGGDDTSGTSDTSETSAPDADVVIDPGDGGRYAPEIDPADFVDAIDNPYLPLTPGSRWVYEGTSEGETEQVEVVVTEERREIMGISAVVVRDTVRIDGEIHEDTFDWYAQDREGNVWYLGEDSKEYEGGEVTSTAGSWEAGVDGALPGIVMPAHPVVGDSYRQEYYKGEAEDLAEVLAVDASKTIGLGDYSEVLVVEEWNPLEPDVVENKHFAPGVGLIYEVKTRGGDETAELVDFEPA